MNSGTLSYQNIRPYLIFTVLGLTLILLTFPAYHPQFDKGIDESLVWAYNYLFAEDLAKASHLLFPHGPLAFLMYPMPLGNNLIYAALFDSFLKLFIFGILFLINFRRKPEDHLTVFLLCLLLFHILSVQMLILTAVLSSFLIYWEIKNRYFAVAGILLAALSLYIKSYIGIISGLIALSFIVSDYVLERNKKQSLLFLATLFLAYPLCRFFIFGSLEDFYTYIYGVKELASDNSAAAAFYPDNNWYLLTLSIACFLLIPMLDRSRNIALFYALTILAAFAAWKHGMARQDIYHTRGLFYFLTVFFTLLNFFSNRFKLRTLLLSICCLLFFYLNLPNVRLYEELTLPVFRINHFSNFVFNHTNFKEYHLQASLKNIASQKLEQNLLDKIGDKRIDIYPWDYSYIAANQLNWQPRPVLHSYAGYSSWLDKMGSRHFNSDKAPEFILLELDKKSKDIYGGKLEGVDYRYLLNDEPQAMMSILMNYRLVLKNKRYCLFEKKAQNYPPQSKIISKSIIGFGDTLTLPQVDGILRLKANIRKSFKGQLQSFLFKDQESFISYYLENGDQYTYKIVPKNAVDGIWLNPFLMHPETDMIEPKVIKVVLNSSAPSFYKPEISIEWESFDLPEDLKMNGLFNKNLKPAVSEKFDTLLIRNEKIDLKAAGYSAAFKMNLDSLLLLKNNQESLNLSVRFGMEMPKKEDVKLVLSVDADGKNLYWEGSELALFKVNPRGINPVNIHKSLDFLENFAGKGAQISIYLWNNGKSSCFINNFSLNFWTEKIDTNEE
jgi:hypothetical protein